MAQFMYVLQLSTKTHCDCTRDSTCSVWATNAYNSMLYQLNNYNWNSDIISQMYFLHFLHVCVTIHVIHLMALATTYKYSL